MVQKSLCFPKALYPCHPVWYHFHAGTDAQAIKLSVELFNNSLEIPGSEVDVLCVMQGSQRSRLLRYNGCM